MYNKTTKANTNILFEWWTELREMGSNGREKREEEKEKVEEGTGEF